MIDLPSSKFRPRVDRPLLTQLFLRAWVEWLASESFSETHKAEVDLYIACGLAGVPWKHGWQLSSRAA
jgi:hypothetical protein